MAYIIPAILIIWIAITANNAEESAGKEMKRKHPGPPMKLKHGCNGCGAPGIMHQVCDYCGRVNE